MFYLESKNSLSPLSKKKSQKLKSEVNKIFLLIRFKKTVSREDGSETLLTAQQRLDAFVDSSALFDSLRVQEEAGGEKGRRPRGVFEFGSGRG